MDDLQLGLEVERLDFDHLSPASDANDAARLQQALEQLAAPGQLPTGMSSEELAPIFSVFSSTIKGTTSYLPPPLQIPLLQLVRARDAIVLEYADHPSGALDDWGWGGYVDHVETRIG